MLKSVPPLAEFGIGTWLYLSFLCYVSYFFGYSVCIVMVLFNVYGFQITFFNWQSNSANRRLGPAPVCNAQRQAVALMYALAPRAYKIAFCPKFARQQICPIVTSYNDQSAA